MSIAVGRCSRADTVVRHRAWIAPAFSGRPPTSNLLKKDGLGPVVEMDQRVVSPFGQAVGTSACHDGLLKAALVSRHRRVRGP